MHARKKRKMMVMDRMNPACIDRKNNVKMNLVLVAVFWNSFYCVADEEVARE